MTSSVPDHTRPSGGRVCTGCGDPTERGEPTFFFDDGRYHLDCVPAEQAARAQALLGVKSC